MDNEKNDPTKYKRFVVGVDRSKMRLFDAEESDQTLMDDTPVFDKSTTAERIGAEKFQGFKL